ncbi:MAG: hypothetical protein KME45_30865 [Stenomitos rutilans HA7619-LM2]|jgi:hypothetical protein|nr:hypothetical protein [Stenomitos rutilans HA7619-LM2]
MSPQDELALVNRDRQQDQAAQDLYLNGCTDADFGRLPQYADTAYLDGYVATLKSLPTDDAGRIRHYSHRQHFAYGYVDSPDPCHCEEF